MTDELRVQFVVGERALGVGYGFVSDRKVPVDAHAKDVARLLYAAYPWSAYLYINIVR